MKNRSLVLIIAVVLFISSVYVLSTPSITGFLTRTGQFTLGNEDINLLQIYLNNQQCSQTDSDCTITGVANSTKGVIVKAQIQDDNGNCDEFTSNNGTAYFCVGGVSVCNSINAIHTVSDLAYDAGDGQWGSSNEYCNLTGSSENWYFFEANGTWTVNVTVTDGTDTDENGRLWYYNEIRGIEYPEASISTIDMGVLNLSSWNNATGYHFVQNSGNIVHNLDWNATDFTGSTHSDVFAISNTAGGGGNPNLLFDDDSNPDDDAGNLAIAYIDEDNIAVTYYEPANGLVNCSTVVCDNADATLDIYWYIYPPYGLHEDTYTNTIQVSATDWTSTRTPGHILPAGGGGPT